MILDRKMGRDYMTDVEKWHRFRHGISWQQKQKPVVDSIGTSITLTVKAEIGTASAGTASAGTASAGMFAALPGALDRKARFAAVGTASPGKASAGIASWATAS